MIDVLKAIRYIINVLESTRYIIDVLEATRLRRYHSETVNILHIYDSCISLSSYHI